MDIRRLSLGVVVISYLVSQGASKSFDVVWISPAEGNVYSPGNTIVAKWTASSALVSPGFKLCAVSGSEPKSGILSAGSINRRKDKDREQDGDESGKCGVAIWPPVRQAEDGFMVSITAPEGSETSGVYLEMRDDFGNVFASPVFGLGATNNKATMSSSTASAVSTTASSETPKSLVDTAKRPATSTGTSSASLVSNNTATPSPRSGIRPVSAPSLPSTQPGILVSRRPGPTAAIAVPLSVVSGIILVAGLLAWRTRRALARDRKRELKSLILSQNDSKDDDYGSVGDVQRAISVLSSRKGCTNYPDAHDVLPLFMAKPEPRPLTRDPYTPMVHSASSGSVYDLPVLHFNDTQGAGRGKSLTAQYTAAGTVPPSESVSMSFSTSNKDIPFSLLPAPLSPLHVRSESPAGELPLPLPPGPISYLSPSGSTNVYDVIAAKLKGHQ